MCVKNRLLWTRATDIYGRFSFLIWFAVAWLGRLHRKASRRCGLPIHVKYSRRYRATDSIHLKMNCQLKVALIFSTKLLVISENKLAVSIIEQSLCIVFGEQTIP